MAVWVISDLHLSLNQPFVPGSVPQLYKPMATFGEKWYDHVTKLYINWQRILFLCRAMLVGLCVCRSLSMIWLF